tara:strand:+ start:207 stop:482 length:276 start_codon:yes stop_codon:yes gene_type:complete
MSRKLTKNLLSKMIEEEKKNILETLELGAKSPSEAAKKTKEVKAEKYASTLADDLNHYKAMKIHEKKLIRQLKQIREAKAKLKNKLIKNLD